MSGWDGLGLLLLPVYLVFLGMRWVASLPRRAWRKVTRKP